MGGEKSKEVCPDYKPQEGRPDSILTLGDSLAAEVKKQGKLKTMRIPFNLYAAPSVESVDALIKLLKVEGSAVPVIMSDQTGQGKYRGCYGRRYQGGAIRDRVR